MFVLKHFGGTCSINFHQIQKSQTLPEKTTKNYAFMVTASKPNKFLRISYYVIQVSWEITNESTILLNRTTEKHGFGVASKLLGILKHCSINFYSLAMSVSLLHLSIAPLGKWNRIHFAARDWSSPKSKCYLLFTKSHTYSF